MLIWPKSYRERKIKKNQKKKKPIHWWWPATPLLITSHISSFMCIYLFETLKFCLKIILSGLVNWKVEGYIHLKIFKIKSVSVRGENFWNKCDIVRQWTNINSKYKCHEWGISLCYFLWSLFWWNLVIKMSTFWIKRVGAIRWTRLCFSPFNSIVFLSTFILLLGGHICCFSITVRQSNGTVKC